MIVIRFHVEIRRRFKKQITLKINFKDHLSKVLERKLINYKRKLIKGNKEDKRRIRQIKQ
jgi:hypothetical protein